MRFFLTTWTNQIAIIVLLHTVLTTPTVPILTTAWELFVAPLYLCGRSLNYDNSLNSCFVCFIHLFC